jgi:hypothetical protein
VRRFTPIVIEIFILKRTGNIRPYLVGGVCYFKFIEQFKITHDNEQQKFRVKSWTTNYELGFGIDIS